MSTLLRALFIGVPEEVVKAARDSVRGLDVVKCTSKGSFESLLAKKPQVEINFAFIGPSVADISPAAVVAVLRSDLKIKNIYYVTSHAQEVAADNLVKDKYTDTFLWPKDTGRFTAGVLEQMSLESEHRSYSAVRLVDIEAGTKVDFQIAIYLAANRKYVIYANAGDTLEAERLARLKEHKQNSLFVPVAQIDAFHAYSARRLRELTGTGRTGGATAPQTKIADSVFELATGLLNSIYSKHLGRGRAIDDHAQKIVSQFIVLIDSNGWCAKLLTELSANTSEDLHSTSVATFAALFSILLGKVRAEDLFAAGLLHDVGISLLPTALQTKYPGQMTLEELKIYKRHTQLSLDTIRAKKFSVSDRALLAIAHHHEKWEGSGYPAGLATKAISAEGQILAVADRFNYLTSPAGGAPLSPDQALRQMERERAIDPDILHTLRLTFERAQKAVG